MGDALQLVGGIPRMRSVAGTGTLEIKEEGVTVVSSANSIDFQGLSVTASQVSAGEAKVVIKSSLIYDETYSVPVAGISAGTPISLPRSGNYNGDDLIVELNGQLLTVTVDYNYVGTGDGRTQITLTNDVVLGDILGFRVESTHSSIYEETYTVGVGGLTAGTPVTLPNSGTYDDVDLKIYIGGQFLAVTADYNYVGAAPGRTQVTFVENLSEGEEIVFRIEESDVTIYDETTIVGAGGITTGSSIILPNSGTYEKDELEVYLNGDSMEFGIDWGCLNCNTIQMTFDLVEGDELRFRIDSFES